MIDLIFLAGSVVVMVVILCLLFSKTGRKAASRLTLGGKVVQEFGEIAKYPTPLGTQTLTLYGLEKDGEKFLAIEVRRTQGVSIGVNWVKITNETLETLNKHAGLKA